MEQLKMAEEIQDRLLKKGAEHCQVHLKCTRCYLLQMDEKEADLMRTSLSQLCDVKVQKEGLIAQGQYVLGNEADKEALVDAVFRTFEENSSPEEAIYAEAEQAEFCDVCSEYQPEHMLEYLEVLRREMQDCQVELSWAALEYTIKEEALVSTKGTRYTYRADGYTLDYDGIVSEGGSSLAPYRNHLSFRSLENSFHFPGESLLVCNQKKLFHPQRIEEPFRGTILMAPRVVYYMLMDYLFGRLFEETLLSGVSRWQDCFGKQVLPPELTLEFDPFEPTVVFGERITQDGCRSRRYAAVEKGLLVNAITGRKNAERLNLPPSGNTGDNLVIKPGDVPLSDMIAGIRKGVILFQFSGEVSLEGDFRGTGKWCLLVENGQITGALETPSIEGNLDKVFWEGNYRFSKEREANGESVIPWLMVENV